MARRIDHREEFDHPAERVYAALTDAGCLRERLAKIGGRNSELVSHTVDGGTATAVMRQGIDAEHLPAVVRRVTPHGVTIERTETWTTDGDGRHSGTIDATVSGMPGSMHGTTALTGTAAGSALTLDGEVKIGIPLIGGKIEAVIAEQLGRLLRAEAKFTNRWLETH